MVEQAYRYHRFSTKSQDRGSSIERQAEATAAMCAERGWTIVETIEDRGRSAYHGDHLRTGNLGKFKARIDAGEIEAGSILVIENLDRLSRQDVRTARRWIEDVTDRGVSVAVAGLNKVFDRDSLSGENLIDLLQYLLESQRATKESARKSEMRKIVNTKHIEKAQTGEIYTKRAPLWLIEKDGRWTARPDRAAIVIQIYEWAASGIGYATIATRLNKHFTAWRANTKSPARWRDGYVRDILFSPAVEGEHHRKKVGEDADEIIYNYYPRIVDAELVDRARSSIKSRVKTGGQKYSEAKNLFGPLARCGECGGSVGRVVERNNQGRQYAYFQCRAAKSGACENTTRFRYDLFESTALDLMLPLAMDDSQFVKADETGPLIAKIANIKKEIEITKTKIDRLVTMIENGEVSSAIAAALSKRESEAAALENDLRAAELELQAARGKVSPEEHLRRVKEVRDAINSDDQEEREQARRKVREAVQATVKTIVFHRRWISQLKVERLIKLELVGGHAHFWLDGAGNVLKDRVYLDSEPAGLFSQILAGGKEELESALPALNSQVKRAAKADLQNVIERRKITRLAS